MQEVMGPEHDIEHTCRTCMKSQRNLTPLFIGELACLIAHPEVLQEIVFFGLEFQENDGLPQKLCTKCLGTFSEIRKFREHCKEVQEKLKAYFINEKEIKLEDDAVIEFVDVEIKSETENAQDPKCSKYIDHVQDLENDKYSDYDRNFDCDSMTDDDVDIDPDACKIELEDETQCAICSAQFETVENLKRHFDVEHINIVTDSEIKCEQCDRKFKRKQDLKKHIERTHTQGGGEGSISKKQFQCKHCDKTFLRAHNKRAHERSHTNERPHVCGVCGRGFRYEGRYKDHIKLFHKNQAVTKAIDDNKLLTERTPRSRRCVKKKPNQNKFKDSEEENLANDSDSNSNYENSVSEYPCKLCTEVFTSKNKLREHFKICTKRTGVICDICTVQFATQEIFQKHTDESHPIASLPVCPICSETFENVEKRNDHMVSTHDSREKSRCNICHKDFISKLKLVQHRQRVHIVSDFKCSVCNEKFSYSHVYNNHMRKHNKSVKCQYCDRLFCNKYRAILHERIHTGERPHLCSVCGMTFTCVSDLNQHSDTHNTEKLFKCNDCGQYFMTRKKLGSHALRKHRVPHETCDACGKEFRVGQLASHKYLAHNGEKPPSRVADRPYPFNCPVCSKGFLTAGSLLAHSKVHNLERKHACKECGSRYKRSDHLQLHIKRVHLKIRNYSCEECGMQFLEKCVLNKHMIVHQDIRPFKCKQCPCDFKTTRALQTHIRTHTGETPFGCGICDMHFSHRRFLVAHTLTHSQEQIKEIVVEVANAIGSVQADYDEK